MNFHELKTMVSSVLAWSKHLTVPHFPSPGTSTGSGEGRIPGPKWHGFSPKGYDKYSQNGGIYFPSIIRETPAMKLFRISAFLINL
jgi:hypothetical protein